MSIPLKVETLCGGGVVEALEYEVARMLDNIADVNTPAKKAREVRLVIKVKPNDQRNMAEVLVQTSSKLVPASPLETSILIDKDKKGKAVGAELWTGETPGQATLPDLDMHKIKNFPNKKEAVNA